MACITIYCLYRCYLHPADAEGFCFARHRSKAGQIPAETGPQSAPFSLHEVPVLEGGAALLPKPTLIDSTP